MFLVLERIYLTMLLLVGNFCLEFEQQVIVYTKHIFCSHLLIACEQGLRLGVSVFVGGGGGEGKGMRGCSDVSEI